MKREIKTHRVNETNEAIAVQVMDDAGPGGASHKYRLQVRSNGPDGKPDGPLHSEVHLNFQHGPVKETGANGITQEALLAVVEDRLAGFQNGPYACTENAAALEHIRAAQAALQSRTKRRAAAGIEGSSAADPAGQPAKKRAPKATASKRR